VLLKRQGFDVIGLFIATGTHGHDQPEHAARQQEGCCSAIDAATRAA